MFWGSGGGDRYRKASAEIIAVIRKLLPQVNYSPPHDYNFVGRFKFKVQIALSSRKAGWAV